jgi:hypothetical protein
MIPSSSGITPPISNHILKNNNNNNNKYNIPLSDEQYYNIKYII